MEEIFKTHDNFEELQFSNLGRIKHNNNLPLDLVYKKILLKRKYGEYYKYDKIGLEINEFIQLKLVEFWSKKNVELLKKLVK